MAKQANVENVVTYTSPMATWPGSFSLPHPDEFSREQWYAWRDMLDRHSDAKILNRIMCYAGLELVQKYGSWDMEMPLDELAAWENGPAADEKMRMVSWVGKSIQDYINAILDPKN